MIIPIQQVAIINVIRFLLILPSCESKDSIGLYKCFPIDKKGIAVIAILRHQGRHGKFLTHE